MKYKITQFDGTLTDGILQFMELAAQRGFTNNSTLEQIYSYRDERRHALWFIEAGNKVVGSFGAHSIDIIPNSYRIVARTCILSDHTHYSGLRTSRRFIKQHQHLIARIAMPWCVNWINDPSANMFISSHPSSVGTQRIVHNLYCPTLVEVGVLEKYGEYFYRGHTQTFWKLDHEELFRQLAETDLHDIEIE